MNNQKIHRLQWLPIGLIWLGLSLGFTSVNAAVKPRLIVNTASWSAKKNTFNVKGKLTQAPDGASVEVFDINGRLLGTPLVTEQGAFSLSLSGDQLASIPCSVRVKTANLQKIKSVISAPKSCVRNLACKITSPLNGLNTAVNTPVAFNASVQLPKKLKHPKYEWDFAGGVMGEILSGSSPPAYKRPTSTSTTVQFVRDASRYLVRFIVTDGDASLSGGAPKYRCEDSVDILVGEVPEAPPGVAMMTENAVAAAAKKASEANGEKDDVVVLPHTDLTMQCMGDQRFMPNSYAISAWGGFNTLNAQVYRKDRLPVLLDDSAVKLSYAAAVNPADPIGKASINSTSQNWPLNADPSQPTPLAGASIQKADWWETVLHADGEPLVDGYFSANRMEMTNRERGLRNPGVDEGFNIWNPLPVNDPLIPYYEGFELDWGWLGLATAWPVNYTDQHGRYMPGRENPYTDNTPQDFTLYSAEQSWHIARHIPLTDIDDSGRVNPFSLLRVAAKDKNSGAELAKTDAVLTSGKDFHCRECHAKGKIAANPNAGYTSASFRTSAHGKSSLASPDYDPIKDPHLDRPEFFDAASDNLYDQEYAAALNFSSTHQFYDGMGILDFMLGKAAFNADGSLYADWSMPCAVCHTSPLTTVAKGSMWGFGEDRDLTRDRKSVV